MAILFDRKDGTEVEVSDSTYQCVVELEESSQGRVFQTFSAKPVEVKRYSPFADPELMERTAKMLRAFDVFAGRAKKGDPFDPLLTILANRELLNSVWGEELNVKNAPLDLLRQEAEEVLRPSNLDPTPGSGWDDLV